MSLINESGSSMSFEELVNLNAEAMAVLDEVPYQPVVYAVPKEWLESWISLLENAVRFQPTLYQQLTTLSSISVILSFTARCFEIPVCEF